MLAGFVPTAAFAAEVKDGNDDGVINYVSFGASNVNGYGLTGYMHAGVTAENKDTANVYGYQRLPVGSYPYLIAAALNEAAGGAVNTAGYDGNIKNGDPFEKVDVDQLAMSSMRMEELRFLLDDTYPGDSYTDWRFYDVNGDGHTQNWFGKAENDLDALRGVYRDAVANADLITLDMGINNFGVYISHQVGNKYGESLEDIDPALAAKYNQAKAYIKQLVAQRSGEAALLLDGMDSMIDSLAYALVGFCVSFDVVMEKIKEINPDATVIVVSIQNLLTGLSIDLGLDQALPLDDIFGAVINAANIYTASGSPYSGEYLYADVRKAGRVHFFVDELLAYNGDPATLTQNMIDCYDVYDDDLHAKAQILGLVNEFLGERVANAFNSIELDILTVIYSPANDADLLAKYLADGANGYAVANAALTAYGHSQKDQILDKMNNVYGMYVAEKELYTERALAVGYDVLTEMFQAGVEEHTINFSALSAAGKGAIEDALLGAILGTAASAIENLATDPDYTFDLDEAYPNGFYETIAANNNLDVSVIKSIACMGIRTGIGNSFYGHPTPKGHQQIADVILSVIEEDVTGKDVMTGEIGIILDKLYNLIKTYGPEVAAQVWAQWEAYGYVDLVKTSIDELNDMLEARYEYYTTQALPTIEGAVGELAAQKDALVAEVTPLKALLAAKKAELAEVIGKQEIGGVTAPDLSIDVQLGNNKPAPAPEYDCEVEGEGVQAELEAAIRDLEHAIATIEALIAAVEADIADLVALAEQITEKVAELEQTVTEVKAAAGDLKAAFAAIEEVLTNETTDAMVDTVVASFEAARATALAAANVLDLTMDTAKMMESDINGMIAKLAADAEGLYNKFLNDLPGCIEQIPEDGMMLIGGAIYALQMGAEKAQAEIQAKLTAEKAELEAKFEVKKAELEAEFEIKKAELEAKYEEKKAELEAEYGPKIAELEGKLAGLEEQIKAEIEAKYNEVAPQIKAEYEAKIAELEAKAAALEAELQAKLAEQAAAATEELRAALQPQIDRITADLNTVKADLEHAAGHLAAALKMAYEQAVAEITAAYEEAKAKLIAAIEELKAEVEAKIAEAKAALDAAVAGAKAELEAAIAAAKAELEVKIAEVKAAAEAQIEKVKAEVEAKIDALNAVGQAIVDALTATVEGVRAELQAVEDAIEGILNGSLEAVEDLKEALVALGLEGADLLVDHIVEQFNALLKTVTTADLFVKDSIKYVAIGDGTAATESYVEELTALLTAEANAKGVEKVEVVNGAKVGNTVADELANMTDVTGADLITIGFSNVDFLDKAVAAAMEGADLDWTAVVGAENVKYVEQVLDEVKAKIAEAGIEGEAAVVVNTAVEAYAYAATQYAVMVPQLVNQINAVNPEAVVVIVGMYNPMNGVAIALDENTSLEIGEYVDYLVKGVAVHGVAYAALTGNAIYVDAPAVQTVNTNTELSALDLIKMAYNKFEALYPSAEGDDYIAAQIAAALNIVVEEEDVLLGDADGNGVINTLDAMRVLKYYTGELVDGEIVLGACDVDGENGINTVDALYILQYYTGDVTEFPAAK
jgi:lysophospholipase L1-like esterase